MKNYLLIVFLFLGIKSFSQSADIKWSKPSSTKGEHVGYSQVIHGDGKYLYTSTIASMAGYTLYGSEGVVTYRKTRDNMIVAYDHETLEQVATLIIGGENKGISSSPEFEGYMLLKAFITSDRVVLFIRNYMDDRSARIAVVELTPELKPIGSPKIVHEVKAPKEKYTAEEPDVIRNESTGAYVLLDETEGKQKNILLSYKTLSPDFTIGDVGEIDLPLSWDAGFNKKGRGYQFLGEDYLVLNANVKQEVPNAPRKKRWLFYSIFTVVTLSKGEGGTYSLKSDEMKYSGIDMEIKNGMASILGFYSNTDDEGDNPVINGFFSTTLDINAGEFKNTVTTEFDFDFYSNFKNYYPEKTKSKKKVIPNHYVNEIRIEKRILKGNKTILVCCVQNNEVIKYSNGNELPHCVNRGVISFVLNEALQIEKFSVIPRASRYDFIHKVDDMEVAPLDGDRYIILYSSNADLKEVNKEGKPDKREQEIYENELNYAIMTGSGDLTAGQIDLKTSFPSSKERKFELIQDQFKASGGKLYTFGKLTTGKKDVQIIVGQMIAK